MVPLWQRAASAAVRGYVRRSPVETGKWRLIRAASRWLVVPGAGGTYLRAEGLRGIPMALLMRGAYEPAESAVVAAMAGPGSVVLDVGANVGYFSLLAAARGAEVHAFEPRPDLAAALRENARLNGLRVAVVEAAASDSAGALRFRAEAEDVRSAVDPSGDVVVRSVALDGYCREAGIGRADLLKIDVEGGEPAVLRGAAGLLSSPDAPAVLVEINGAALGRSGSGADEVLGLLRGRGYEFYLVGEHGEGEYLNALAVRPPMTAPAGLPPLA